MTTYCINFYGSCEISANSEEEAKKKFWRLIYHDEALPSNWYDIVEVFESQEG